jgi:hypothetical protein
MMSKTDADEIREYLRELKQATWLGEARRWWVGFAFHHTSITNIRSILESGELLSRSEMERRRHQFLNGASSEIIGKTAEQWKNHVRFYFRPRTPTLFQSEGFRPQIRRQPLGAHCPIPVYLLFDLEATICHPEARFSDGNLAATQTGRVNVYNTASDFRRLPFQLIYHDAAFLPEDRDEIVLRRHAEIIIPQQVGLGHLKRIWCRTQAEYETLKYLLGDTLWQKWQDKITARTDYSLFHRQWIHIEKVDFENSFIRFYCNPCRKDEDAGPFEINLTLEDKLTHKIVQGYSQEDFRFDKVPIYNWPKPANLNHYVFCIRIDGNLAYSNEYSETSDIPF